MGNLTNNIETTREALQNPKESPAIVQNTKDNMFYLASVTTGANGKQYVQEIHPSTRSKNDSDICRMNWEQKYKQIQERVAVQEATQQDYTMIADPRELCKL